MTCICHYSNKENIFTTLKVLCALCTLKVFWASLRASLHFPSSPGNHWSSFSVSIALLFPKYHTVGIMQGEAFSDCLLLLSIAFKFLNILQMSLNWELKSSWMCSTKVLATQKNLKKTLHCSGPLGLRRGAPPHQPLLSCIAMQLGLTRTGTCSLDQCVHTQDRQTAHWTPGENASFTPQGRTTVILLLCLQAPKDQKGSKDQILFLASNML